ncbi:MAG: ASCH domain-containing protein [Thermoplasmatota archaeon]
MKALLSIKPKYIEEIANGNKKYEFRKYTFKKRVKEIWIYATSPAQEIVGLFSVGGIIKDTPQNLWDSFKKDAGICEKEFFDYFNGNNVGYAIKIGDIEFFDTPLDPWEIFPNFSAPQSYCYLREPMQYKQSFEQSLLDSYPSAVPG